MAVQKIEYENKTYLQNDPNIPEKNKVTEANMNEIKSKVNNNADELSTAQQNIEDLQAGQGTASGDIASLKNRVTTLEGDNTKNKQDIANKVDKVEGKGLSTEDYTTAEKEKLAGLNNYDDTEIKKDIQDLESDVSDIKSEQETQNDLLERTQSALINITTPKSSNINVKDSSDLNAKIDVFGISEQDGEPSPSNIVDIENVTGDIDITVCNKNLFNNKKTISNVTYNSEEDKWIFNLPNRYDHIAQKGTFFKNIKANTNYTLYFNILKNTSSAAILFNLTNTIWNNNIQISAGQTGVITNNIKTKEDLSSALYDLWFSHSNAITGEFEAQIMICEGSETDNNYVKYQEQLITFPLQENQRLADGDKLASDGIHHKRTQVEIKGIETQWIYYSANDTWARPYVLFLDKKIGESNDTANVLCNKAKSISWMDMVAGLDEYAVFSYEGDRRISISVKKEDLETQDIDGVKKYFQENNMVVEYNLEEEEIEAYSPEQQEAYDQLQKVLSYYNVTNVFTDKAQLVFKYIADTQTWVLNKINNTNQQVLNIAGGN